MTKVNLDDLESISRIDSSGMLSALDRFPDPLVLRSTRIRWKTQRSVFHNLVLMGMGGSASAADFVLDWLKADLKIPSVVLREPALPTFIDSRTLFVGISYSGETFETLAAFKAAAQKGAVLAGVGTGGTLAKVCAELKAPFVGVEPSVAPRAALSQLIMGVADLLESLSIVRSTNRERRDTFRELVALRKRIEAETPLGSNPAKRLASELFGHFLSMYSLQRMASVGRRFKNQLAENSKEHSKYDALPEASHNEIVAWQRSSSLTPVIIRDTESPLEHSIVEAFRSTIQSSAKVRFIDIRMPGRNRLSRLLVPTMYLDYVSTYLALLKRIDPTRTELITEYKRKL